MLDDRKLSARALFDDSSHRQTQLAVRVHTGQTLCYKLPFHVYVSVCTHKFDIEMIRWLYFITNISVCLCCRTRQITSGRLASRCGLRSTTQRVVQCWMKAGQQLSRNLWVVIITSFFSVTFSPSVLHQTSSPLWPLQIQFFKDCGEDDVCTTDLVLQAHMDISGTRYRLEIVLLFSFLSALVWHAEISCSVSVSFLCVSSTDRSLMWFAALVGVWRWRCSLRTDWKTPTTPAWRCTIHATCTSPASALG